RNWLDLQLAESDNKLFSDDEREVLESLDAPWHKDKKLSSDMKSLLLRLCTHYLINAKKSDKPVDPVCNFHLSNGARLERLNWLADTSAKGLKQSAGMMANYHYKLSEIDENHEAFMTSGKIVASKNIRSLL
ncbi:MAG: malonyl-CoA decarboxylase family protein, partial [Rickettsiales bacterium]